MDSLTLDTCKIWLNQVLSELGFCQGRLGHMILDSPSTWYSVKTWKHYNHFTAKLS